MPIYLQARLSQSETFEDVATISLIYDDLSSRL